MIGKLMRIHFNQGIIKYWEISWKEDSQLHSESYSSHWVKGKAYKKAIFCDQRYVEFMQVVLDKMVPWRGLSKEGTL